METNTSLMINLNGSNYELWKTRMEDLLYVNGFHQPLFCSDKPDDKTNEEWSLLHRRVCGYIRQWVDDTVLNHVSEEINASTLWSKLAKLYAPNTCNGKLSLIKQLMSLRYHDGTAMSDHVNGFQTIINQLSELGIKIGDEVQGLWFLGTLPDSWETLTTSVLNTAPDGAISVKLAKDSVLNEETRRKSQGSTFSSDAEAPLYTVIKVARDEDLHEQIGKKTVFDLVDHDKVFSFRIQNQISFALFKEEVARKFGIPVQYQRFWLWDKRGNRTYRPSRPLTPLEEAQSVSSKAENAELTLFLEVGIGKDSRPVPPPAKAKNEILLFFKLYDPLKEELRYVGRLFVKGSGKPTEILTKLNELAGFALNEEIELFREIKFEPNVMCDHVDKKLTFQASQLEEGDIICFQKPVPVGTVKCRYPDVPSFLEYVHNHQPEVEGMLVPHSELAAAEGPQPMEVPPAEAANTVDAPVVDDSSSTRFTWTIENFSKLASKKLYSDVFFVGGYKWRVLMFPKGNNVDHLSMYLDVAESTTLPSGWRRYAQFSLAVVNQMHSKFTIRKDTQHQFNARESDWGFTSFMPLCELYEPDRGYLVNDTCIVEAVLDSWSQNKD